MSRCTQFCRSLMYFPVVDFVDDHKKKKTCYNYSVVKKIIDNRYYLILSREMINPCDISFPIVENRLPSHPVD